MRAPIELDLLVGGSGERKTLRLVVDVVALAGETLAPVFAPGR